MSAFIVSKQHIDAIVSTATTWRFSMPGSYTPDSLGQMLWSENVASVNYRYNDESTPEDYRWSPYAAKALAPVQALKAIACLAYQSCEHPAWESSAAYRFCENFKAEAISRLPGYAAAAWEIH